MGGVSTLPQRADFSAILLPGHSPPQFPTAAVIPTQPCEKASLWGSRKPDPQALVA